MTTQMLAGVATGRAITNSYFGRGPKHADQTNIPPEPAATPPRLRTIIDALFTLSDESLQYLEPLITDLAKLESIKRAKRRRKK